MFRKLALKRNTTCGATIKEKKNLLPISTDRRHFNFIFGF